MLRKPKAPQPLPVCDFCGECGPLAADFIRQKWPAVLDAIRALEAEGRRRMNQEVA